MKIRNLLATALAAVTSIAAGNAQAHASASKTVSAAVSEALAAPRFRYDFTCMGPIEHERADYVAVRAALEAAELEGRASDALALKARLDAFVLEEKWQDGFSNLITTAGKNDLLTQYFKGSAYTAAWFVMLVDNASFTAIAAGDTMSSHSGWIESVAYSNSTRPSLTLGTASAGSIDNSASKASYTINATATINGAACTTVSTKSGTTGTLYSAGSFGSTRSVINGDTLNVQVTLTV